MQRLASLRVGLVGRCKEVRVQRWTLTDTNVTLHPLHSPVMIGTCQNASHEELSMLRQILDHSALLPCVAAQSYIGTPIDLYRSTSRHGTPTGEDTACTCARVPAKPHCAAAPLPGRGANNKGVASSIYTIPKESLLSQIATRASAQVCREQFESLEQTQLLNEAADTHRRRTH
jgi:hypothetical protein